MHDPCSSPVDRQPKDTRVGLYVHVPFCHARCAFCAFYLQIHSDERVDVFLRALDQEIEWYGRRNPFDGHFVDTVYFGGGTPTSLTAEQLIGMLDRLRACFSVRQGAEITVEGHPDLVSPPLLERLVAAGATRLSLGAESMDQGELARVGRPTTAHRIATAVAMARAAGFTNLNLDLMYGLPGQTPESWSRTLDGILALEPAHLSCYALTVEDETALAHAVRQGTISPPDAALQTELEWIAESRLAIAGYRRYELSNYARPGSECRHNRLYWENGGYLGLGPSAESYLDGIRFGNVADLTGYARDLRDGRAPLAHREVLSPDQQQREALVFGLRQLVGIDRALVDQLSHDQPWRARLDRLIEDSLVDLTETGLRLTAKGRQLADSVAMELI